jgi:hypothetical protein
MKTESIRVDPQIGLLLVQDSLPSAPPTSAACSTASLHEALPSVGAKQMLALLNFVWVTGHEG